MKIIFYLLPCVMNIIMGLFFFITMRRLAISGADSFAISGTMAVWAFIYAIVSALLGAVQNKKNATKFILAGEGILILSMAGFLIFPSMDMQYVWLFGSGIGTAMFFAPFQVIVKMLDSNETAQETLPKTAAVYTFSWSFGFASGPFIAAMIWGLLSPETGWRTCYKINILLVLAVTCVVWFLHCFIRRKNTVGESAGQEQKTAPPESEPEQKKKREASRSCRSRMDRRRNRIHHNCDAPDTDPLSLRSSGDVHGTAGNHSGGGELCAGISGIESLEKPPLDVSPVPDCACGALRHNGIAAFRFYGILPRLCLRRIALRMLFGCVLFLFRLSFIGES